MTNKLKQVADPDGVDERTYRFAVSKECFGKGKKFVRTKTHEYALAAGGAR